jgi:hypothetical protein
MSNSSSSGRAAALSELNGEVDSEQWTPVFAVDDVAFLSFKPFALRPKLLRSYQMCQEVKI